MLISTEERDGGWIAFFGNDRSRWDKGASPQEAIGKLLIAWDGLHDLTFRFPDSDEPFYLDGESDE